MGALSDGIYDIKGVAEYNRQIGRADHTFFGDLLLNPNYGLLTGISNRITGSIFNELSCGIDAAVNNMFSGQAADVKATTSQVTKGKELYKAWLEAPKDQKDAKQKAFNDFYNTCSSNATVRLLYNEVNKKTTT